MPELPEVEVVRMSLEPRLVGERLTEVAVHAPALREPLDRPALEGLAGGRVERLRRRSKYLLIDLEGDAIEPSTLVIHLGMSGRLTVVAEAEPLAPHEHVAWGLAGGGRLRLVDPRRFGQALVLPTVELERDRHFARLGVEPLGPGDPGGAASLGVNPGAGVPAVGTPFSGAHLAAEVGGRRGPIKTFLMDASVVVGVGNIYASESLWRARVHPRRSVARVAAATWDRLAVAVRETLTEAIREGGTTLNDFTDGDGQSGYFQVSLAVYGREGEPCPRCGRAIRRLVQTGRSTFYCPGCQR